MMIATDPPLIYLRPESWRIIQAVQHARVEEGLAAFFTVDAGPPARLLRPGAPVTVAVSATANGEAPEEVQIGIRSPGGWTDEGTTGHVVPN